MVDLFKFSTVTTANTTTGDNTNGNAHVTGIFSATTLVANTNLRGGSVAASANLNIVSNTLITAALFSATTTNTQIQSTHVNVTGNTNFTGNAYSTVLFQAPNIHATSATGQAALRIQSSSTGNSIILMTNNGQTANERSWLWSQGNKDLFLSATSDDLATRAIGLQLIRGTGATINSISLFANTTISANVATLTTVNTNITANVINVTGNTANHTVGLTTFTGNTTTTSIAHGATVAVGTALRGGTVAAAANLAVTSNTTFSGANTTVSSTDLNVSANAAFTANTNMNGANVNFSASTTATFNRQPNFAAGFNLSGKSGTTHITTAMPTAATAYTIGSFPHASWRAARATVVLKHATNGTQILEMIITHDGTNAYNNVYGTVRSGGADLATITTSIISTDVAIRATSPSASVTAEVILQVIA
jgi:hypothetical protein